MEKDYPQEFNALDEIIDWRLAMIDMSEVDDFICNELINFHSKYQKPEDTKE